MRLFSFCFGGPPPTPPLFNCFPQIVNIVGTYTYPFKERNEIDPTIEATGTVTVTPTAGLFSNFKYLISKEPQLEATLNINQNFIVKKILNHLVYIRKSKSSLSWVDFIDLLKLARVCKHWENNIIPHLDYGIFNVNSKKQLELFIRLRTRGIRSTPFTINQLCIDFNNIQFVKDLKDNIEDLQDMMKANIKVDFLKIKYLENTRAQLPGYQVVDGYTISQVKVNETVDEIFKFLGGLESQNLVLKSNGWIERWVESGVLSNLVTLNIPYMRLGEKLFQLLDGVLINPNLHTLNIIGNNISEVGGQRFATLIENSKIVCLDISLNHLESSLGDIIEAISKGELNWTLKDFKMAENYSHDNSTIRKLCNLIESNKSITRLDFNSNPFNESLSDVFTSLLYNQTIKSLNCSNTSSKTMFSEIIGYYFPKVNNIEQVYMGSNNLQLNSEFIFGKESNTLRVLDLSCSNVLVNHLNGFVGRCKNLARLDLSDCKLSESEYCQQLIESVFNNPTITDLNLGINTLGDHIGTTIAQLLETNTTLSKLNLANNIMTKSSKQILVTLIEKNRTLTSLNMRHNNISNIPQGLFKYLMVKNQYLTQLDLSCNGIPDNIGAEIFTYLPFNVSLVNLIMLNNLFKQQTTGALNSHYKSYPASLTNISISIRDNHKPSHRVTQIYPGITVFDS
ncbi:hypothetical protein DLAC_08227 [Tieghemostelium lacteum]|uniref:Uncharacterized protein n=1 Tax=Tieghemostelium lacteum TaxID=361077 RepID=A0A151ZBG1_TIELA|nr:hypothetical protein DLAC_08227 [Tieghemostelium lacteum]|eukprot:KYQ91287.1 hypothetical protein DLAC_08227 [Tieghemostelium lacteum]